MASLDPSLELKHVLLFSVPLLIAPLVILLYFQAVRNKKNAIRLPPSPLRLPIIGHLHLMVNEPHRSLQNLARSLGPVVYLQLGDIAAVVVSSPEAATEVLKTHDVHCCSRPSSPGKFYYPECRVCVDNTLHRFLLEIILSENKKFEMFVKYNLNQENYVLQVQI
jgi:4-hydroxyphenylacetaldehyde oxime monooxygenase